MPRFNIPVYDPSAAAALLAARSLSATPRTPLDLDVFEELAQRKRPGPDKPTAALFYGHYARRVR